MRERGRLRRPGAASKPQGLPPGNRSAQSGWPTFDPKVPSNGKEAPASKPDADWADDGLQTIKGETTACTAPVESSAADVGINSRTYWDPGRQPAVLECKWKEKAKFSANDHSSKAHFNAADPKGKEAPVFSMSKKVETLPDKWRLLPAFFESRGLVSQHLASYNFLITHELRAIVRAAANRLIKSDVDPAFFLEFLDIQVGDARLEESMQQFKLTPKVCRVRELSYSAPLLAEVEYSRGHEIVRRRGVCIGYIPVMVRSKVCALYGKTDTQIQQLGECPLDPGGYFIVKGTEKVTRQ